MKIEKEKWNMNGEVITRLILLVIGAIILCSQSFASNVFSLDLFVSVINHNSIYLLVFVYFILLQFSIGKKYFNYLNLFLVFVYFFVTLTSILTMVQSFGLSTVLDFSLSFIFIIYLVHTLFRGSRIWDEFQLTNSPFNELTNEWLYYAVVVLSLFSLAVDLISTSAFSGVAIACLDFVYHMLFGRYIFLYRDYLDKKKMHSENKGNFDEVRGKIQVVLDKTEVDDKIVEGVKVVKDKVDDFVEKNEIKEKVETVKDKIQDASDGVKDKVQAIFTEDSGTKKKSKTTKKGDK